jgi:hypothetical protein
MRLKETMKKDIEEMDIDELLFLFEQIKLLKRGKSYPESKYTLEQVIELTSTSESIWSEDISEERQERG